MNCAVCKKRCGVKFYCCKEHEIEHYSIKQRKYGKFGNKKKRG